MSGNDKKAQGHLLTRSELRDRMAGLMGGRVAGMVLEAQDRAREIVRQQRDKLDAMAARLLTAEVVEEEEIQRPWGAKVTRPETIDGRGHAEAPPESPNPPVAAGEGRTAWTVPRAVAGTGDEPERP